MVRWKRLLNFVSFELGWFACALGAAGRLPLVGPVVVAGLLGLQLFIVPAPRRHALFVLVAALLGWLIDSALFQWGVFSFPHGSPDDWLCPIWMAALWANFAGTLHFCLDWLRGRYWLAAALGAIGGPLAYYGGQYLGAIQLGESTAVSLTIIAMEWALAVPGLVYLSARPGLDGLRPPTVGNQESKP